MNPLPFAMLALLFAGAPIHAGTIKQARPADSRVGKASGWRLQKGIKP